MMRIVKIIQFFVLTVDRQSILSQVICSDAEKVYHVSQTSLIITAAGVSIIIPCSGILY